MSRLTLTDDKGKTYPVKFNDGAPLVDCDRATGVVTCPTDATAGELDAFAIGLARVFDAIPAFRAYPVLREPVS